MNDTKKIFDTYCDFVTKVTSEPSLDINSLKEVIDKIQNDSDIDAPRILTAALGLSSEAGEFTEIVKKMCAFDKRARESMRDRGNIEDNSLHHLLATDCRDFFKSRLNLYTKCLSGNDFKNNACLTEIGALFFNLQRIGIRFKTLEPDFLT